MPMGFEARENRSTRYTTDVGVTDQSVILDCRWRIIAEASHDLSDAFSTRVLIGGVLRGNAQFPLSSPWLA